MITIIIKNTYMTNYIKLVEQNIKFIFFVLFFASVFQGYNDFLNGLKDGWKV